MESKRYRKPLAGFLGALAALFFWAGFSAVSVRAESGTVYTCVIHPCYAHPVTGVIEDSGGEASYATGQGMVDSAVYTTGMLEVTDSGNYYLTIRLSLMDYTSGHSFWVQSIGDSGWSTPALGVTGSGTDSSGGTTDVCIQVPSENCVIRGSMYVQPMGRDVIFYLYPSDFTQGNSTDMNATMVTAVETPVPTPAATAAPTQEPEAAATPVPTASPTAAPTQEPESAATPAPAASPTAVPEAAETPEPASTPEAQEEELQNTITEEAVPVSDSGGEESLNASQGLSLSTQEEAAAEETGASGVSGSRIAEYTISLTLSGLILLAAGSGVVYLFRKNWKKWGGGYEDDDEEE